MTTTTPQRRAGGMSLIEVLRNIDGARPSDRARTRRTAHPTGEAWIPPRERLLSARPPMSGADHDPVQVVRVTSSRAAAAAAAVTASTPAPDPRDHDHDVEVVLAGPATQTPDPRDPDLVSGAVGADRTDTTSTTDLEASTGHNRLRREALELLRELDRIA